jgi:hypothetical protein
MSVGDTQSRRESSSSAEHPAFTVLSPALRGIVDNLLIPGCCLFTSY